MFAIIPKIHGQTLFGSNQYCSSQWIFCSGTHDIEPIEVRPTAVLWLESL